MTTNVLEGWCTDPYAVHEARWISAGCPTSLVRDAGIESSDPIPQGAPRAEPVPIAWGADGATGGIDMLRCGEPSTSARDQLDHAARSVLTRTHD